MAALHALDSRAIRAVELTYRNVNRQARPMNQSSEQTSSALAVQQAGRAAPTIGDYSSATQLRADRWSALHGLSKRILRPTFRLSR